MSLPVIYGGFHEEIRGGCPVVVIGGLVCVDVDRAALALGLPIDVALRLMAKQQLAQQPVAPAGGLFAGMKEQAGD